jgi:trk system potassium uptake protein TrkA
MQFESAGARLIEVTLAERSPAAGATIEYIGLPRGAAIVAVLRDGHVIVPRSDIQLRAGDEVVLLVTDDAEDHVRSLLVVE